MILPNLCNGAINFFWSGSPVPGLLPHWTKSLTDLMFSCLLSNLVMHLIICTVPMHSLSINKICLKVIYIFFKWQTVMANAICRDCRAKCFPRLILWKNVRVLCFFLLCSPNHSGQVMHICISRLTSIGSGNGSSPVQRQAITWTNVGLLSVGILGTSFGEIWIGILSFTFNKCIWTCGLWNGGHFVSASICMIMP